MIGVTALGRLVMSIFLFRIRTRPSGILSVPKCHEFYGIGIGLSEIRPRDSLLNISDNNESAVEETRKDD